MFRRFAVPSAALSLTINVLPSTPPLLTTSQSNLSTNALILKASIRKAVANKSGTRRTARKAVQKPENLIAWKEAIGETQVSGFQLFMEKQFKKIVKKQEKAGTPYSFKRTLKQVATAWGKLSEAQQNRFNNRAKARRVIANRKVVNVGNKCFGLDLSTTSSSDSSSSSSDSSSSSEDD
eukprot:PhF_6_TR8870/c0_g1_i2/m.14036